ncbi:uncharacterized protein METZ01_LOCUS401469 [marine metagenome]|uniref:Uncharacterized protein n=1 Tax=marine metagenome TaxID=408172 RepID=A0A382VRH5_9ZZZZ
MFGSFTDLRLLFIPVCQVFEQSSAETMAILAQIESWVAGDHYETGVC